MELSAFDCGEKRFSMLKATVEPVYWNIGHVNPVSAQMGGRIFRLNSTFGGSYENVAEDRRRRLTAVRGARGHQGREYGIILVVELVRSSRCPVEPRGLGPVRFHHVETVERGALAGAGVAPAEVH